MIGSGEILPVAVQAELCLRFQRGDRRAGDRLIRANSRFLAYMVHRYAGLRIRRGDDSEIFQTLYSAALHGYAIGMHKFDLARGRNVNTCCRPWVAAHIGLELYEQSWSRIANNPDRSLFWSARSADPAADTEAGFMLRRTARPLSIDAEAKGQRSFVELLTDPDASTPEEELSALRESAAASERITAAMKALSERERWVIEQRFLFVDVRPTLEELGACLGVTREWVRLIQAKGLAKLATALGATPDKGVLDRWRELPDAA